MMRLDFYQEKIYFSLCFLLAWNTILEWKVLFLVITEMLFIAS